MDAGDKEEQEDEEEDEEDDYSVDEHGLFTFPALMEVDTETHITCMDCGVVGRLNQMYKWKKPRVAYGVSTDIKDTLGPHEEMEIEESVTGKKRTFEEMEDEKDEIKKAAVIDSDDEEFERLNQAKKRKKKKKKKKKRPKIDLSRFD